MSDPQHAMTWAQVAGIASFMGLMLLILSFMIPIPWIILATWVDERAKTKRILAQARLQEAKNAARQQDPAP